MSLTFLLDTGPLVASLNRREQFHQWATSTLARGAAAPFTCEPVIAEACFLTRHLPGCQEKILALLETGAARVEFSLAENASALSGLMTKYRDVPMSLADACLVRMAEMTDDPLVITLDSDFRIYRMHGRKAIPLILPADLQGA